MQPPVSVQDTVTYPPGAVPGQQRIVIDGTRGAIFEYLNGAGLGNTLADNPLAGSWASSAGTDPYGNIYPQGLQVQGTIEGNAFILNSAGFFLYSSTPALGNLIGAWSSNSGVDQFGNAYPGGFFMGGSGLSGAYYRVDQNGVAYFFNAAGNNIIRINPSRQAIYLYNSSGGAAGNLIVSLASVAGTDPFGNSVVEGLQVTQGTISGVTFNGTNFIINSSGTFFYSGTPASGNLLVSIAPAAGTDGFGNAYVQGFGSYANSGNTLTQISGDTVGIGLASANLLAMFELFSELSMDGITLASGRALSSTTQAWIALLNSAYTSPNGSTPAVIVGQGPSGAGNTDTFSGHLLQVRGSQTTDTVFAWHPGSSRRTEETWQSLGSPGAGITVNTARYRMLADGTVMIQLNVNVTTGALNYTFPNNLPAAYLPSSGNDIRNLCSYNAVSGAAARCFVSSTTGSVQLVSATGANLGGQYDITFVFPVI